MQSLKSKVAIVASATRGAGRGIACMLGEAGATVSGQALSAGYLAREYGFTDIDGTQPPGYYPASAFDDGAFKQI